MSNIIDGKALADSIRIEIAADVAQRIAAGKRPPGLTVILVGADPASAVYVRNKKLACEKAGLNSEIIELPAETQETDLLNRIDRLNANDSVDGILVQLPLPKHIDEELITDRIRADKDVDGFHPENIGKLLQKRPGLRPCTPWGCMKLIESTGTDTRGLHAVVVGASNIVGRPMAMELLLANATVTICNSKTQDLPGKVAQADIVVAGVGIPEFVKGAWIKPGAIVIDVGINRGDDGKLIGDVEFAAAAERAAWITPVPGGVGPMTVTMLLRNTLLAAESRSKN